ncbi:MAG: monomethylamine:corrinoid methyltransferase [Methanobacteriota archaeon]|nr:MAG: monomethylamine:corrinoid methyltransferase [Euryarchaeota archaeon]
MPKVYGGLGSVGFGKKELEVYVVVQVLDVMEKTLDGPPMSENDYQLRRYAPKVQEKVREYKIKFDPDNPIPADNSLADDLFEAGLELLVDVGAFCLDSSRVISYTESEVREGLRNAPSKVFFGEGRDRKAMVPRKVEDNAPPWCLLGAAGGPVSSDESFLTLMEGFAEIPQTNSITTPAITRVSGMRVRPASPLELYATMRNAVLGREACNRVGREGKPFMNTLSTAESDVSLAAAVHPRFGLRPSDGFMIASMDPMKVDFARLNKAVIAHSIGAPIGMDFSPLVGGYSGGPEGTAVGTVATHLMGMLTLQTSYLIPFPLHLRYVSNSSRELLWTISTMGQAISRNTDLLSISLNYTAAGPCTPMCLYETSASVMAAVASGLSMESVGVATNKYEDRVTPVEPRISAEVGHAIAGMKRSEANEIAKKLLKKYETRLASPPLGKSLQECWNASTRRPTKEYSALIKRFKKNAASIGLKLEPSELDMP